MSSHSAAFKSLADFKNRTKFGYTKCDVTCSDVSFTKPHFIIKYNDAVMKRFLSFRHFLMDFEQFSSLPPPEGLEFVSGH